MSMDRRNFIRTSALAGAALGLSNTVAALAAQDNINASSSPMNVLVLGGTGFIGPPMVEYLLARGHKVSIFNRGQTNTDLFPEVERLVGDRSDNLEALRGREWDVVFDNHATLPRWVRQTAELLQGSVGRYIHVSTISVYAEPDFTLPDDLAEEEKLRLGEDAPLARLPGDWDGSEEITGATYGPFKWQAEAEAEKAFPGKATIVRPGLIVGPGDPTDRFTYWPLRIQRGGEVLAPGTGRDSTQIIDARDLVQFIVRLAENDISGVFNATGPESRLSMAEMLYGIRAVTGTPVRFTWVSADFLAEQTVAPWGDMPCWIPGHAVMNVRLERALEAGLTYRPLADTVSDTLDWYQGLDEERRETVRAGLIPERETEVLAAWHSRDTGKSS